jgi:hypothetical protein
MSVTTIAFLIIAALSLFVTLTATIVVLFLLVLITRDMRDILTFTKVNTGRLAGMEKLAVSSYSMQTGMLASHAIRPPSPYSGIGDPAAGGSTEIFQTEDGRHSASSLEELMHKIANDPNYKSVSPDDIDKLKRLFESSTEDDDDEDSNDEFPELEEDDGTP